MKRILDIPERREEIEMTGVTKDSSGRSFWTNLGLRTET